VGKQITIFDRIAQVTGQGSAVPATNSGQGAAVPAPAAPSAAEPERPIYLERSAVISDDGRYRYRLVRRWSDAPLVAFIMLNPSTADANEDDPTIRRCEGFARAWGHGGLLVANLFAFRATDPRELVAAIDRGDDAVGPDNNEAIRRLVTAADVSLLVAAWGTRGYLGGRDAEVCRFVRESGRELCALRVSKDGFPGHPLYLPAALKPVPYAVGSAP